MSPVNTLDVGCFVQGFLSKGYRLFHQCSGTLFYIQGYMEKFPMSEMLKTHMSFDFGLWRLEEIHQVLR